MKISLASVNLRQRVVLMVATIVAAGLLLTQQYILPAYDRWQGLREEMGQHRDVYARLTRNISKRQSVNAEYAKLPGEAMQLASDEATLSQFMQQLERLTRGKGLLNGLKLLSVKQEGPCRIYRINMTVSGSLPDVIGFLSAMTNGAIVVGLESFVLRGVRKGDAAVECTLFARMVRLTGRSESNPGGSR